MIAVLLVTLAAVVFLLAVAVVGNRDLAAENHDLRTTQHPANRAPRAGSQHPNCGCVLVPLVDPIELDDETLAYLTGIWADESEVDR